MADQYRTLTSFALDGGVSDFQNFATAVQTFDMTGTSVAVFLYNASSQVLTASLGGPDVSNVADQVTSELSDALGNGVNTDTTSSAGDYVTTPGDLGNLLIGGTFVGEGTGIPEGGGGGGFGGGLGPGGGGGGG